MRRLVMATGLVGLLLLYLALAALTAQRAEGRGPLAGLNGAQLLDQGSIARLRASLVWSGGVVTSMLPDGVIVLKGRGHGRRGTPLQIDFVRDAQYIERGAAVGRQAIEPGAHLTVLGLPGNGAFQAVKVRLSPPHHRLGGYIIQDLDDGSLTLENRHHVFYFVELLPHARITRLGRAVQVPLKTNMHVLVLAIRDPRQSSVYLADEIRLLAAPSSRRVGGLVSRMDAARNLITIVNKTEGLTYTIEVSTTTKMTLSKWSASYADMAIGDHLTVTGLSDPAHAALGPNLILAKHIRISSPNFGGVITRVDTRPAGAVALTVRAHHNHILQILAPGRAAVLYGAQPAHVLDLLVGQKISARGLRTDKFALTATFIHIYPHAHTVGGTVQGMLPGSLRILDPATTKQYIIRYSAQTVFTLNGKRSSAAAVKLGLHIRVHGYDALRSEQKSIPIMVATHISIVVHHPHQHTTHKKQSHPAAQPSSTATPTPPAGKH